MTTPLVARLRERLRPDQVRDGVAEVNLYRRDASNLSGHPAVVCFAEGAEDVQAIVRVANEFGVPFVPRGSGTGLAGGAVPIAGSIVVSTSKMNRIISVDAVNRMAWVEPGVLNLDLSTQIAVQGVHFAPDPSSQQTCSIGGNVANNSGGPTAWPTGSPALTSMPSKWCSPTARSPSSAVRTPSRSVTTCAGRSSAARGCSAWPRRSASS